MGQTPRDLAPSKSLLHFFGAELRRLRQEHSLSQAALGRLLNYSGDQIRRIECAERLPTREFVGRCDELFDAGGGLLSLWPLLEREQHLHTTARPAFRSDLLDRPVLDWLILSADSTRRALQDEEMSRATQTLQRFRDIDHQHGAGETYAEVSEYIGHSLDPVIASAPQLAVGFLELAGYEAVDLGADGLAQQHYLHALEVATRSGGRLYGGYLIAVSLAHLALHCGDVDQAARLATAAIRGTDRQASPALRATFGAVLARAHARRGDQTACYATLHQVEADLARSDPGWEPDWIAYFGEADLADEKAHCFFDLGRQDLAQREASLALALLAPTRVRRLAIDTALLASSLARSGEVEEACAVGRQAVGLASRTESLRSAHRIALMLAELHPYADRREVRDLAEYAREAG